MGQDKKKLFMEGCAPKPLSADEESSDEDDLLPIEEMPVKTKKEKKKKKEKKHKKKKKREDRSESGESDDDRRSKRNGSEERGKADTRVSARDFFRQEKAEQRNGAERKKEKSPHRSRSRE